MDLSGHLLATLDFQQAYRPQSYPTSLTYDRSSGHLFVFAPSGSFEGHMVEMSPDGSAIFSDVTLVVEQTDPPIAIGAPSVREDGIWASLGRGTLRHYSRDGAFIEDLSVAASFPLPNGGPAALTISPFDSVPGGFLLTDFSGERLVDVDRNGHERADVTTAVLGDAVTRDGRVFNITFDPTQSRIFVVGNNNYIYVLSPEYLKIQNVNTLLQLHGDVTTSFDPTPVPAGVFGTYTIHAIFDNISDQEICNLFFRVTDFSTPGQVQKRVQWLEGISFQTPLSGEILVQGFDQGLIGHQRFLMPVQGRAAIDLKIDLQTLNYFNFFVDAWGSLQRPGGTCP